MVEMEARFVVSEARNEAGTGKGGVSPSASASSSANVVRAAATAALAASQVGLVALAIA